MKVLSISNEKGGVGKTVFAANLAWELAIKGYLVVTIDLDQQTDLTKLFYRSEQPTNLTIYEVLKGECTINDACYMVTDNLYIVLGSRNIKHFDLKKSETLLKEALQADDLNIVNIAIIDHPPSTSEATLLGHVAATDVLVVTDTEGFRMDNIGNLLDDLTRIKETMNPDLKVLGVVANRVDMRRNLTKLALRELQQTFGDNFFKTCIPNNTAIPTSVYKKKVLNA